MNARHLHCISLAIAIASASQCPSVAHAVFVDNLSPRWSFNFGRSTNTPPIPSDIPRTVGQEPLYSGVKLYGDFGPINGSQYRDGLVLYWGTGLTYGLVNPGDDYVADVTFDAHATGGTLAWGFYSDFRANEGFHSSEIETPLMPMPASGHVESAHFASAPFTFFGPAYGMRGYLNINWSGFSPTDTLTITVPQNSVDNVFSSVPEPASLLLVAIAVAAAAGYPRR